MRSCITRSRCVRCSTSTIAGSTRRACMRSRRRRTAPVASEARNEGTYGSRHGTRQHGTTMLSRLNQRHQSVRVAAALALLAVGCRSSTPAVSLPTLDQTTLYEPSRALGPLFHDVQLSNLFPDSKTFVDARPLQPAGETVAR